MLRIQKAIFGQKWNSSSTSCNSQSTHKRSLWGILLYLPVSTTPSLCSLIFISGTMIKVLNTTDVFLNRHNALHLYSFRKSIHIIVKRDDFAIVRLEYKSLVIWLIYNYILLKSLGTPMAIDYSIIKILLSKHSHDAWGTWHPRKTITMYPVSRKIKFKSIKCKAKHRHTVNECGWVNEWWWISYRIWYKMKQFVLQNNNLNLKYIKISAIFWNK